LPIPEEVQRHVEEIEAERVRDALDRVGTSNIPIEVKGDLVLIGGPGTDREAVRRAILAAIDATIEGRKRSGN
jgi:hypothetical protein